MRRSWEDIGGVPLAIVRGEHDDDLSYIQQACKQRLKRMWREGMRVQLKDTRSVELEGAQGVIDKVNVKSISVMLDDGRGFNVSPELLEQVA